MADKILTAEAIIKAKDATGGVFEQIAQKVGRLSRAANSLNRDIEKQLATAGRVNRAAAPLTRYGRMVETGGRLAAETGLAYGAGAAAKKLVTHTAIATAERQHEEARMAASGMTDAEVKEAAELAGQLSAKYKPLSQTSIMHTARNVRAVVGTFEEASKILDPLMQLRVVAEGAHPERTEELEHDFDALTKGMEIKGVTQNLPKFVHYMDGMAKALNVFGDTLRPTDYYEMFKYGRAATTALSDDFMLKTAPTLAQELGGSSTGKALSSFYTQFVGGKMSNLALAQLLQYGMVDPSKVIKTKTGAVKGVLPGGIVGSEYLQPGKTDPYQWVNKVLMPHLAAKGITDPAKIQEVIAALSSQQTTAQMLSIFATQQSRIEKDQNLVAGAHGLEAAQTFMTSDPKMLGKSISAQADNVLANAGQGFGDLPNKAMGWMASALSYMSEQASKDPKRAAGWLGWTAGTLGAASADAGASVLSKLFNVGPGNLGLTRLMATLAPILDIATRHDVLDPSRIERALTPGAQHLEELRRLSSDDALINRTDFGDDGSYVAVLKAKNAARRAMLEGQLSDLGYAGPDVPGRGLQTGLTIDALHQALYPNGQQEVKATIEGNATLSTEVVIKPSSEFWASVEQKVQNGINAFKNSFTPATGTAGSSGRSMPEATAPM